MTLPQVLGRHHRQTLLPGVGPSGQARLAQSSVLVVGAGGLGCPALLYLAAAGVGRLGIADPDRVDLGNLQRQILYSPSDVGELKVDRAYHRLKAFDPSLRIDTFPVAVEEENALAVTSGFDVVLDGTDNFRARYLMNDTCRRLGLPLVQGSVLRFGGQLTTVMPKGPCYRCLFPEPPEEAPTCADAGVLGALPGVIGALMATEALKILLHTGDPLCGRFVEFDALATRFREHRYERTPDCPLCCPSSIQPALPHPPACAKPTHEFPMKTIDVNTLAELLRGSQPPFLLDVREAHEVALCRIPGAVHIAMGEVSTRLGEIPSNRPVVVQCHHGGRSARIAQYLLSQGYPDVINLEGGIDAWSVKIAPEVPRY